MRLKKTHSQENTYQNAPTSHIFLSLILHLGLLLVNVHQKPPVNTPIEVILSAPKHQAIPPPVPKGSPNGSPGKGKGLILTPESGGYKYKPGNVPIGSPDSILTDPKYVYSTFFDRVRASLDSSWQSSVRQIILDYMKSKGKKFPNKRTDVLVILSPSGELLSVSILSESGDKKLDELALRAFKESARFPNPPKDLIKDDQIKFDWSFYVRTSD